MTYTLRVGTAEDVPALPDIERAAASLFVEAGIGGDPTVMPEPELVRACQSGGLIVIADASDTPVGFAVLAVHDGIAHLAEMDVHPEHQRRGLGSRMVRAAMAWSTDRAANTLILTTYRDLPWNGPFYATHGFAPVEPAHWTAAMATMAKAEGVTEASGRIVMELKL
ncbi:MAG: GNAT family N-acetyltransferase [Proteobacteria bacterium]|nr:GNAT family N-acetyltransferase [Pseudomonadota bacterium]